MLSISNFHDYQLRAANHLIEFSRAMLWLFMGAGKTVVGLTAFAHLQRYGQTRGALVLGPKRVIETVWHIEALKWSHLNHLRFSIIRGTAEQRLVALSRPADIYLTNYENLPSLVTDIFRLFISRGMAVPFDYLILDEVSKVKNIETKRWEALLPILPYFSRRVGLTGTPSSNGLADLFGQFLAVDDGVRLGYSLDAYKNHFFVPCGYGGYKYEATDEGKDEIYRRVSDITLEMSQDDYLKLPPLVVHDAWVDLPPRHRRQYDRLEMELFTELDNGVELEVVNEASKVNKCLQFSNGAAYTNTETREWEAIHDAKLDALDDILEEANGEPVLLAYAYRSDAARILKKYPWAQNITDMTGAQFEQALEDWQARRLRLLIGHPASMGHGIDGLQKSCRIMVWFGLTWSLENYLQFVARVHRQGQGEPVRMYRIFCNDTFDEVQRMNIEMKGTTQDELRRAVGEYRKRKGLDRAG